MAKPKTSATPLGTLPVLTVKGAVDGLLLIGDPHVWSRTPGRRRDASYLDTILGKIRWAAMEANRRNLWAVILGDLLHESTDNDLVMLSKLVEALGVFERTPVVLVGNHDKSETRLTPGTGLHLLHQTGQIHTMINNGPFAWLDVRHQSQTRRVLLGGTPYGDRIPISLAPWIKNPLAENTHDSLKKTVAADDVVWITHDDMAFDHAYPNAQALHPILGVDAAVNGHMHATQKPVQKGGTVWYNPGNITRNTVDLIDHVPRVWVWTPQAEATMLGADGLLVPALEPLDIPHAAGLEVMSLEGRITAMREGQRVHLAAAGAQAGPENETPEDTASKDVVSDMAPSRFVALSQDDSHTRRTDDGAYLQDAIEDELTMQKSPEHIRQIVSRLFAQALEQHRSVP